MALHLTGLLQERVTSRFKVIRPGVDVALADVGAQGWNLLDGDLQFPVVTLNQPAVAHNVEVMRQYCERHGVLLAPHGKTTMAPQLFDQQVAAGSWAITVANPSQVVALREFGVPRILLANEIVDPRFAQWVAAELNADPTFEFICLVDSVDTLTLLRDHLGAHLRGREVGVMVEIGVAGGRTGVRDVDSAVALGRMIAQSPGLRLLGVEGYEGLAGRHATAEDLAAVDAFLDSIVTTLTRLEAELGVTGLMASAGGSAFFDRVIARVREALPATNPVILRSGCYISHDAMRYHEISPLDGRRASNEDLCLTDALRAWAHVLSVPEPGLAIVGAGKRDVPFDVDNPLPLRVHRGRDKSTDLVGARCSKLMDQHAFIHVDPSVDIKPGDIIEFGLSHPCGAFEKSALIPLVDDNLNVRDAIRTFF